MKRSKARMVTTSLFIHAGLVLAADTSMFFFAKEAAELQPASTQQTQGLSNLGCSSLCSLDDFANGFNYSPLTGNCTCFTLTASSTIASNVTGSEVWLKEGQTKNGTARIARHPDGNVYVAFVQYDTSLEGAKNICLSSFGAYVASFSSRERMRFHAALLGPNVTTVHSGFDDMDFNGLFFDTNKGLSLIEQLRLVSNSESQTSPLNPCMTVVFQDGNASNPEPYFNKTVCNSIHPWICGFKRREDRGCWSDPPVPLGARGANTPLQLPVATGYRLNMFCENGEKFVNGIKSRTVQCNSDGYWRRFYPYFPCTGGANFLLDPATAGSSNRTCYKVNMENRVRMDQPNNYCKAYGGSVLSLSNTTKAVFETLPRDPVTNVHYGFMYTGFAYNYTNDSMTGGPWDVDGNAMDVSSFVQKFTDFGNRTIRRFLLVTYNDSGPTPLWSISNQPAWYTTPRIICKFTGC